MAGLLHASNACTMSTLQSVCVQEAEFAEMLKARIDSGKSASTSASKADAVDGDTIFADLDTEGESAQIRQLLCCSLLLWASCFITLTGGFVSGLLHHNYQRETKRCNCGM